MKDQRPMAPRRRMMLTIWSVVFLVLMTAGLVAGAVPPVLYVVSLGVLGFALAFAHELPLALRLGERISAREQRATGRPGWQQALILGLLILGVAVVISFTGGSGS